MQLDLDRGLVAGLLILVLLAPLVVVPGVASASPTPAGGAMAAPAAPVIDTGQAAVPNGTATPTPSGNATGGGNATATTTPAPSAGVSSGGRRGGPPTMAEQARVNPFKYDEAHLSVQVAERDKAFNTSGPHALFSISEPVRSARIIQPKAEATVLGRHQVMVEYADDAAPTGQASLYTLEVFFKDGSSKRITLYATDTGVSVAATGLTKYRDVLKELREFAKAHGYGSSPEELVKYLRWVNERADLVEHFLSRQVIRAVNWLIAGVMQPVVVIGALASVILIQLRRQRKFKALLEFLQNAPGRWRQKVTQLQIDWEEAKRTADDDLLSEVQQIGSRADVWEEVYGFKSPAQMAEAATVGEVRRDQDEEQLVKIHDGVSEIDTTDLENNLDGTWLEPMLRYIPDQRQVLNHLLGAIKHMETEHNQGARYRATRDHLKYLLDELDRIEAHSGAYSGAGTDTGQRGRGGPGLSGTGAGGDD